MAIVLNNITSGYNLAKINANFQNIEDYINDKLLARADTGVVGEAMMERALDMNGNKILNVFVDVNDPDSLLTLGVADSRYYNVSGDTLTGPMNANGQVINNLPTPTGSSQAVNKAYADSREAYLQAQINRSLRVPESSVELVPNVLGRKGKLFAWNDQGNPIAVHSETDDGTQLEIDLAGSDGFKYIGKCPSIAVLRTIEPTVSGQAIILERAVAGGPVLNEILFHNPAPSDAVDDGFSRFVTTGGAVWDADISNGHNVFLAGYSDSLNNLAQCINAIALFKVNDAIARGYVAGGSGARMFVPSLPKANGQTIFVMTDTVRIPTFLSLHLAEGCILDYSAFTTATAIVISNEFTGLTNSMFFLNNGPGWGAGTGASAARNEGGLFAHGALLKGPNVNATPNLSSFPGLRVGNVTYPSGSYAHCRNARVYDLRVSGFNSGLRIGSVDTYMPIFERCQFVYNNIGIDTSTNVVGSVSQWANSGETIIFRDCIIGENRSHAISRDDRGDFFSLIDCNIDYNGGDVMFCSPLNLGKTIIRGGHIEGNAGLLLNCPARTTTAGENNLKICDTQIYSNSGTSDAYGGVRNQVFGNTIRTVLELDNCDIFSRSSEVNSAYGALKHYNTSNLARIKVQFPNSGQTYRVLPSYDGQFGYRLNNTLLFSGTEDTNIPTTIGLADFYCIKTGSSTCVYGGAGDADSDGVIPVKITLTSASESVQLLYSLPLYASRNTQHIHGYCSVKVGSSTGSVNVASVARSIKSVTRTANLTTGAVTDTEVLAGINSSTAQNITTSLSATGITLTSSDYMGTRPLGVQMIGGIYSYMGFSFTGFVGTIYVKLPVWANLDLHPTFGYL